jgi:hypothetical protein
MFCDRGTHRVIGDDGELQNQLLERGRAIASSKRSHVVSCLSGTYGSIFPKLSALPSDDCHQLLVITTRHQISMTR